MSRMYTVCSTIVLMNKDRFFPSLKVNPVEQKKIIQVNEMKFFPEDLIMTCCFQPAATGFTDTKSVMFLVVPGKENLDID